MMKYFMNFSEQHYNVIDTKMALRVEVGGFGLCRTNVPYAVFIICVQQERFEAWTVYRRLNSFTLLRDQLISHHPSIAPLPHLDPNNLDLHYLENSRNFLDRWLQGLTSNTYILRMQSMYQFLCIDANMPPPYLEVHWRNNNGNQELEMDDMFEGDDAEEDQEEWDEDDRRSSSMMDHDSDTMDTVFMMDGGASNENKQGGKHGKHSPKTQGQQHNGRNHNKKRPNNAQDDENDAADGMDIQSLSFVEAEFIYNKKDEDGGSSGKHGDCSRSSSEKVQKKRTINLDAFKIIKVIGKGKIFITSLQHFMSKHTSFT